MIDLCSFRPGRAHARRSLRTALALVALVVTATTARAWDASTPPRFFPSPYDTELFHDVALQPGGGVIVAGTLGHPNVGEYRWDCSFVVARVVRRTGAVDWRTELPDCGDDEIYEFDPARSPGEEIVRVDAAGDVVVARFRARGAHLEVVKLDGTTGADDRREALLVKYEGSTGTELWRHRSTLRFPGLLAVAASGDVLASAARDVGGDVALGAILALDGVTGAERWQSAALWGATVALTSDRAGDVVAAGNGSTYAGEDRPLRYSAAAAKLDGATGATLWQRSLADLGENVEVQGAAVDPSGTVVVAAREVPGRTWLAGLDGRDGKLLWTIGLGGADTALDVRALRIAAPGRVIVAGARSEPDTGTGFALLGIDVPSLLGPRTGGGRRCIARLAQSAGAGRPGTDRCAVAEGRGRLAASAR